MVKNEVFEVTAPNGLPAVAVIVSVLIANPNEQWFLCYGQNRLFYYHLTTGFKEPAITVAVDYAILPQYDTLLKQWRENHEED